MPSVPPRRRADRLDLVARLLADRPGLTTAALAQELDVSVRSIFRDLQALRDRGYPVEGARGRGGGLRLPANWGLGKVLFSRDEALCTLLALAIADKLGLPMFAPELGRARRKITGAFSRTERRRIAPLRERIFVGPVASPAVRSSYTEPLPAPMRRLQVAFVEERVVRAEYRKEGGASSVRRLEPHALVINWPAWYVLGYDHSRARTRTFRLDRFLAVEIESEPFRPRAQSLVEEVLSSAGVPLERV